MLLPHHGESTVLVAVTPERLFEHVDDHARLSSHMNESSWRMGGGRMTVDVDAGQGRRVGSRIRVAGKVFGVTLGVEETVIERVPPQRKVWETIGRPRLLVVGSYRMGFEIMPRPGGSVLRVFIDYALPDAWPGRWLGYVFGRYYAAWCTKRMADDAARHFGSIAVSHDGRFCGTTDRDSK